MTLTVYRGQVAAVVTAVTWRRIWINSVLIEPTNINASQFKQRKPGRWAKAKRRHCSFSTKQSRL